MSETKSFLKWVGGKTQLLPELSKRLPENINRYYEPFLGGGALYFNLQIKGIISDLNEDLIATYKTVRDDVECLIELLKHYQKDISETDFYTIREKDRDVAYQYDSPLQKAARLIYLNKTCFNGLYRVNSKGYFNSPYGHYKNPKVLDEQRLRECSLALQKTEIECRDFRTIMKETKFNEGDFIYFDPPYVPLSKTSSFTYYTFSAFDSFLHLELLDLCRELNKTGAKFMLSNSSHPMVLDFYKEFNVEFVEARRNINSNGDGRGKIKEVIVRNY